MNEERLKLARQLLREHDNGRVSYSELARRHNMGRGQVSGCIRDARAEQARQQGNKMRRDVIEFPVFVPFTAPLPDDTATFRKRLGEMGRWVQVAAGNDIHFPHHSPPALNLWYRLIHQRQPDIIIVGSDSADLDLLSKFTGNPDRAHYDALVEFRSYWIPHINTINRLCPNAVKVFVMGNHEERLYTYAVERAAELRLTIEEAWLSIVRYGGTLWLGNEQQVLIGRLLAKHGDRVSKYVAQALLEMGSYQVNVMAGHVHRLDQRTRRGEIYTVEGITSGCLCELRPWYAKARGLYPPNPWQHGAAFAMVDMEGTDVFFDNLRFAQIDEQLIVHSNGERLEQAQERIA